MMIILRRGFGLYIVIRRSARLTNASWWCLENSWSVRHLFIVANLSMLTDPISYRASFLLIILLYTCSITGGRSDSPHQLPSYIHARSGIWILTSTAPRKIATYLFIAYCLTHYLDLHLRHFFKCVRLLSSVFSRLGYFYWYFLSVVALELHIWKYSLYQRPRCCIDSGV